MTTLSEQIARRCQSGHVNAYAGFGKTHLIAETIQQLPGCQLVLTHTHAGVDAIKKKFRKLNVPTRDYWVDTIAGFALRLCLAYRQHSQWFARFPEGDEWSGLYSSCLPLLRQQFIRRILNASFTCVFVDEYQDCSLHQHKMTQALAELLPTIVLGDPLQAVFDFEEVIDWCTHVEPSFPKLGSLDVPHRWREADAPKLGEWLVEVRSQIENGGQLDLNSAPAESVRLHCCPDDESLRRKQINVCKYFDLPNNHTVAAIHGSGHAHKANCQRLAKNTSGVFSSIEEVEGKRLRSFVADFDEKPSSGEKLQYLMEFLKRKCMSRVQDAISAPVLRGKIGTVRSTTKNPAVVEASNAFLDDSPHRQLHNLLTAVKTCPEITLYACDLFERLMSVAALASDSPETALLPALEQFQATFRHSGRPVRSRRVVATTLLIKGLEFDHAIVLNAAALSPKDLYVALTRGSRTLTVLSTTGIVNGC